MAKTNAEHQAAWRAKRADALRKAEASNVILRKEVKRLQRELDLTQDAMIRWRDMYRAATGQVTARSQQAQRLVDCLSSIAHRTC
ncbi:MAG: hypothetical protein OXF79_12135 [Chloroflexi bacterium]|nr:hypothetical protein [Chloroflexota bacterium]